MELEDEENKKIRKVIKRMKNKLKYGSYRKCVIELIARF